MSSILIEDLKNPAVYPHAVDHIEIIETHLSWIILTGSIAYKIKKPVNLGFQDFTTLEKRKYYCELEVLLNQRLAPSLYLGVVSLNIGTTIEYAVKMHQFSQENLLSNLAINHQLSFAIIDNIATQLAHFYEKATRCNQNEVYGNPEEVFFPIKENFTELCRLNAGKQYVSKLNQIEEAVNKQYHHLQPLLAKRKKEGWVRACHGDLHLGNMVLIDNQPVIFDCIEFNEPFRWTDVMCDLGFLTMDLERFSYQDLSHLLINRYCEKTFDYEGISLLRFYQCYRAMVRAKVSAFQLEMKLSEEKKLALEKDLDHFITLAEHYTKSSSPTLTITFGVSGSGKTFESQKLFLKTGAIRLRSDLFRLQLFPEATHRYSEQATKAVYSALVEKAALLLQAGYSVIIDAACLKQWQRDLFLNLSKALNISFHILALNAPIDVLQERIKTREAQQNDASEATLEVLKKTIK